MEDALLAAHGGDGRFVALAGEAGMGKTRLARELAKRAQRLGWAVLWGGCSEAELSLPYLPLVEALGNYLSDHDAEFLARSLGPARRELAQLFPQVGGDEVEAPVSDPAQAKLRLFESVVALLRTTARKQGLLLVVEDVHWADSATRELLDHVVRRLNNTRSLSLVTYRNDEVDRRHPLAPLLQTWRRSGLAELVTLCALQQGEIAEMISAILEEEEVESEFRDFMYSRTEGNPFVLEEMLKEAIDHGDVFRVGNGWERRSLHELRIPESVRDTIALRFARLEPAEAQVLQVASVLGRTFDYATLRAASGAPEPTVQRALEVGVSKQLLEEVDGGQASYRWRHALTQEAIRDEIVLPRRQAIHSRAADALVSANAGPLSVARHLLGAARFEEAVPVCVAAADAAEATLAFAEALELVQRALPYVDDQLVRSRLLCRMGRLLWIDGKALAAAEVLAEGAAGLEHAGADVEAARYRLVLGRCRWEQNRPDEAREQFECARRVLEQAGPSPELAVAYLRLAGLSQFSLDPRALELASKAVEIARAAGANSERVWATSLVALALVDQGRVREAMRLLGESFDEARHRGYSFIAHNIAGNDAWIRLHTLTPGVGDRVEILASEPGPAAITGMTGMAKSWVLRASGDPPGALDAISGSVTHRIEKIQWRTNVELAEVLLELGRLDEAATALPAPSERAELQDLIYDAGPQIRLRLHTGRLDEAVQLAREIAANASRLAPHNDALAIAVEALVAARLLDEAQAVVDAGRALSVEAGGLSLDEAQGRILLASGEPAEAATTLLAVAHEAAARGFRLVEWRARTLAGEALGRSGRRQDAERELTTVAREAGAAGAALIRDCALAAGQTVGITMPRPTEPPGGTAQVHEPEIREAGERMITSMFADVRGYTALTLVTPPADMVERMTTLYRWAAAEVGRHHGFVDKFAGDAVMATFNATGKRLDHARDALEAALALSGKAALLDLALGIGISVGPAVVGPAAADGNISVLGSTTNLAARLQTAAAAGEIVLSDEAHRRVADWLTERGLKALPETLELKGFKEPHAAWRLHTSTPTDPRLLSATA